jgi:hypothetical protein
MSPCSPICSPPLGLRSFSTVLTERAVSETRRMWIPCGRGENPKWVCRRCPQPLYLPATNAKRRLRKIWQPVRHRLHDLMSAAVGGGKCGPEELRSTMMHLQPKTLGMTSASPLAADPLLAQFSIDLLVEVSGTRYIAPR